MGAVLQGPAGQTPLESVQMTIGRASDNQLVLADVKASGYHAVMILSKRGYTITDLGSTNGTLVNERLLKANRPRVLVDGDSIQIGDTVFLYKQSVSSAGDAMIQAVSARELITNQDEYAPYKNSSDNLSVSESALSPDSSEASCASLPAVRQKSSDGVKLRLLLLVTVLVLGAIGGGIPSSYLLSRTQPVISATSSYQIGSMLAGSTGTALRIVGQKFFPNSTITFLLDGKEIPQNARSSGDGSLATNLTITDSWPQGLHQLKAQDAVGSVTPTGIAMRIVAQGQAHTPGPNGAPSDDANFIVNATLQAAGYSSASSRTLIVAGRSDYAGGTVCDSNDRERSHVFAGNLNGGLAYTATTALACGGSYKAGQLSYAQTITRVQIILSNGLTCSSQVPFVYQSLQGTFTSRNIISGTWKINPMLITCTEGISFAVSNASSGTWTGQIQP